MKMSDGLLDMALAAYLQKRNDLLARIQAIQKQLGLRTPHVAIFSNGAKPKRTMSAAAKKRIAVRRRRIN
jgi:hypothetical protein